MDNEYKKLCPKCQKEMVYSNKYDLKYSIINNKICRCCSHVGKLPYVITEDIRKKLSLSHKGKPSPNKGRKWSNEYKQRMSNVLIGRIFSEEHCLKISNSLKGRKLSTKHKSKLKIPKSEETKYKLRIATIKDLKNKGIKMGNSGAVNYNPVACEFIDKLNKEKGWNLQHALNGGEIELYGYFVDGYDKERNIIFEYDEKHHKSEYKLKKDKIREDNLIKNVKPSQFIRYDEVNNQIINVVDL